MNSSDQSQLLAIQSGSVDWVNTALFLQHSRQEELWREQAASFTEFLNKLAANSKRTPFTFWRGMAAAEYYSNFRDAHQDLNLPELGDIGKVSPENIELVQKISRFAPDSVVTELMMELLAKKIGRSLLKQTWEIYRGMAEGYDVCDISGCKKDIKGKNSLVEASLMVRLLEEGADWCCNNVPAVYRFFPRVHIPLVASNQAIDAVAVVSRSRFGEAELHGVFVATQEGDHWNYKISELAAYQCYLDKLWVAVFAPIDPSALSTIPDYVGIVEISPRGELMGSGRWAIGHGKPSGVKTKALDETRDRQDFVRTIRPASSQPVSGTQSGILPKLLLSRT